MVTWEKEGMIKFGVIYTLKIDMQIHRRFGFFKFPKELESDYLMYVRYLGFMMPCVVHNGEGHLITIPR
jgi:hypothetical protein